MVHLPHLTEEWLAPNHVTTIEDFRCENQIGNNHVQVFLQEQALNLMTENLVRTRLFFDQHQKLVGFHSLFNDTIKIGRSKRDNLDIRLPYKVKEIPAIRLHYIGIDDRFRGNGYGDYLMASVMNKCSDIARESGCTLITLEATEDLIDFYKRYGFIYVRPSGNYYIMVLSTKLLIDI